MEVCQAAFGVLLEGFSRVRRMSSEGRAAMAMDVSDLQVPAHPLTYHCSLRTSILLITSQQSFPK
jgi:hypothetical protein